MVLSIDIKLNFSFISEIAKFRLSINCNRCVFFLVTRYRPLEVMYQGIESFSKLFR